MPQKLAAKQSHNSDFSHVMLAGDQVYSTEVQRWCPDRQCFAASQDQLPTGQADVFEVYAPVQLPFATEQWTSGNPDRPYPLAPLLIKAQSVT